MHVAGKPGGFDGAVEDVAGFYELAAQKFDLPADRVGERDEFALSGDPGDGQGAFGVTFGVGVVVEVELGAGEVSDGVETLRNLGIVEGVDEGGGLTATCQRSCGGVVGCCGERSNGGRGGEERSIAERLRGAQCGLGPLAHRFVVHDGEAIHRQVDHQRCCLR